MLSHLPHSPKGQCFLEVMHCSHVSWQECGSCKGFILCISGIIYLFVVFLCRLVDDVAFVYLVSGAFRSSGDWKEFISVPTCP